MIKVYKQTPEPHASLHKPSHIKGLAVTEVRADPCKSNRGLGKKRKKNMKIKLFYQCHNQTIQDFETEVNDFMATVEVVDVKYTEATAGHYEELGTNTGLLVLYK